MLAITSTQVLHRPLDAYNPRHKAANGVAGRLKRVTGVRERADWLLSHGGYGIIPVGGTGRGDVRPKRAIDVVKDDEIRIRLLVLQSPLRLATLQKAQVIDAGVTLGGHSGPVFGINKNAKSGWDANRRQQEDDFQPGESTIFVLLGFRSSAEPIWRCDSEIRPGQARLTRYPSVPGT